MDIIVNAIVLKSVDYKDNDKILTLYSLEKGKITAGIKGVKKSGAKLKFASEPFALCEYVLAERAGRYTVIGATYIDTFFNLRLSLEKYYTSSVILETLNLLTGENEPDHDLFTLAINAVKHVNYQSGELTALNSFLLNFINLLGYGIQKINCNGCDCKIDGRVFFSSRFAEFYCSSCRIDDAMEITLETYEALSSIFNKSIEDAVKVTLPRTAEVKLLKFLTYYLQTKTEVNVKSIKSLIDFIS
ncbi:MAG: DNA repair protein RecO [Clostridia bacterium]|nr:DNA repair protein RecO [Clostridia bacterium]